MTISERLNADHPIRKSKAQKAAFRAWAIKLAQELGYAAREEKKGSNVNVIIGEPDSAQVLVTAHYDTPPAMPIPNIVTPLNVPVFLVYQVGMVLAIFLVVGFFGAGVGFLTKDAEWASIAARGLALLIFALLMFGPANKHNVNDNGSGVAAVFETMSRVPAEERGKVAFVLFDNEEKGMVGSAAFARMHEQARKETLVVNMDCVGDGEHIIFLANKRTRALSAWTALTEAMQAQTGRELILHRLEKCIYPSDQGQFKLGVAVCACKKNRWVGYYCDKIHTKADTICEQANMDFLSMGLAQFIRDL